MKTGRKGILSLLMAMVFVLSACTGGGGGKEQGENQPSSTPQPSSEAPEQTAVNPEEIAGEITVWTFVGQMFDDVTAEFNKVYPNVKVNVVPIEFVEMHDKLQTTLISGSGAPDVALVEESMFSRYVVGDLLQNLLEQPFDAGRYKDDQPIYNWERWHSIDGQALLGMPFDITPGVAYYRTDILEELGLPSDPEELGAYMQDADNYIAMGQVLEANGKLMLQLRDQLMNWKGSEVGFFNEKLEYVRTGQPFVDFLATQQRLNNLKVYSDDFYLWTAEAQQQIRDGKMVMILDGTFAPRHLNNIAPEQAGKWRATKLPLGLSLGFGGSTLVLPKQSPNKDAAWLYIDWIARSEEAWKNVWTKDEYSVEPSWKSIEEKEWYKSHTNAFLGEQRDFEFYASLTGDIPVKRITSLDPEALVLWTAGITDALNKNLDPKTTIDLIADKIATQLGPKIEQLKTDAGIQ